MTQKASMMRHLLILFTLILIGFTGATLWLSRGVEPEAAGIAGVSGDIAPSAGEVAKASIGGAFTLTDQNGNTVSDTDFRGKLMLVFFGFSHCPDICPMTLERFTDILNGLGADAGKIAPIFITVDESRDTPQALKEYLSSFHAGIIGLTGSKEQIASVVKAYKAYASRVEEPAETAGDDNYLMNHSGLVYLMGRDGTYLAHFGQDTPVEKISTAVKEQLAKP